jgi:hypothetical protein
MTPLVRENRYSGLRHHAKVHSFRILTVVLAWLFIAAAFYQKPELLTWLQRAIQRSMETIGDSIPPPWGPRIEFVFREIGGFIWLQITVIVILLRVILSGIASAWTGSSSLVTALGVKCSRSHVEAEKGSRAKGQR